jgi:hypothetical protein
MNDELSNQIFPYPAKVRRVDAQTRQADLLALAKERGALDPAIFEERPPFFWGAEISNDQIDAYYTHMLDSTLNNFAADARAGVSFLNSHRHMELPFGRSVDGQIETTEGRKRVVADFYTLPGLTLNGVSTDDLILGMRSGIVSDVSVGFFGGQHWCDICKTNYLSWDCMHIAGMKYEVKDRGLIIATVGIDNARLSETSAAYDGATPDATIIKAQRMAESGDLKPEAVRALEARYRVKLPTKRSFAGASVPERKKAMEFEQIVNQVREALGVGNDVDLPGAILTTQAELTRLRPLEQKLQDADKRIATLEPQAADGAQYRSDLVTEALAEGVRAYGDKFDAETYTNMLKAAPLATIKRMKTDWQTIGDQRLPQGRQTKDEGDAPGGNGQQRRVRVPDSAYKA